jgi:hypothetical protein
VKGTRLAGDRDEGLDRYRAALLQGGHPGALAAPGGGVVEPDALEPELVICSRPSVAATNGRAAWIAFRPYDQPAARIYVGDRYFELEEVELEDLLSVVDEAERLA